jgi:hypothetical protein
MEKHAMNIRKNLHNAASSTANAFKKLALPSLPVAVGYLSHEAIQIARGIDNPVTKQIIKDQYANISSTTNALTLLYATLGFVATLMKAGVWHNLTNKQRAVIGLALTTAIVAGGYSLSRFGVEQNVLAAGIGAGVAVIAEKIGQSGASMFARRTIAEREPFASNTIERNIIEEETRPFVGGPSPVSYSST